MKRTKLNGYGPPWGRTPDYRTYTHWAARRYCVSAYAAGKKKKGKSLIRNYPTTCIRIIRIRSARSCDIAVSSDFFGIIRPFRVNVYTFQLDVDNLPRMEVRNSCPVVEIFSLGSAYSPGCTEILLAFSISLLGPGPS